MLDPACRLYAILAPARRTAVIFRRGPSKRVLLIRWWLDSDTFEIGQWFMGRIYERRCDLSPNGELLVYFAQDFGRPLGSWTAISKPPFLTALALWPKGDCWGGGGLFKSDIHLDLNHRSGQEMTLPSKYKLPKRFRVTQLGEHAGWGEDDPILHMHRLRDGWWHAQAGHAKFAGLNEDISYPVEPNEIYTKPQPGNPKLELRCILRGIGHRQHAWYLEDYAVAQRTDNKKLVPPALQSWTTLRYSEEVDWADWDRNGDLLFAKDGRLYRLAKESAVVAGSSLLDGAREIADFRALRFAPKVAPQKALSW
jgi:hypothetical protein